MSNKLVRNEQRKLTATYLNGVGMAVLGVGGFAPVVSMTLSGPTSSIVPVLVFGCILASSGLHLLARQTLGGLEE
ncbi:amino acid transporter [Devosia aurantiaca]|uniref:amino acid transporter n=1 Tax=Devosia aurantiaca TaxID=2714858 RepID=UPI002E2CE294|nr:amino acid transporter [Devosia aurantiaca]